MAARRMGKYELGKVLGTGNFSKVRIGIDAETKESFAIKIIDKQQLTQTQLQAQLKREIAVLKSMCHPNIVTMREALQTSRHIYIVLELVTGGDLFSRIVELQRVPEPLARKYFQQLILGVRYCHHHGVAHRDLKPENILLDQDGVLKISDFGLANLVANMDGGALMETVCGTPNYVAPEVIKDKGYNGFMADIWSCGVILYVMLSGHQAFDDPSLKGLFGKVQRGEYTMSRHFTEAAKQLIAKMLVVDPNKRATIDTIIKDPWFTTEFDASLLQELGTTAVDEARSLTSVKDTPFDASLMYGGADGSASSTSVPSNAIDAVAILGRLLTNSCENTGGSTSSQLNRGSYRAMLLRATVDNAVTTLRTTLQKLVNSVIVSKEAPHEMRCHQSSGSKGLMTFKVEATPTMVPLLTLVEFKKGRGDSLNFYALVKKLHADLAPSLLATAELGLPKE